MSCWSVRQQLHTAICRGFPDGAFALASNLNDARALLSLAFISTRLCELFLQITFKLTNLWLVQLVLLLQVYGKSGLQQEVGKILLPSKWTVSC